MDGLLGNTDESAGEVDVANAQQCTVQSLYVSGAAYLVGYLLGLIYFAYRANWIAALLWLILLPSIKWAYLRFFPRISPLRGYGGLDDKLPAAVEKAPVEVTFYSLLGCPFCPIVEKRLRALQEEMGFRLTKVDLTLKPQVSSSKGIRSVPVVEVGNERLTGNATTEQLARLIGGAQTAASPAA
jgi:glutaredoxin